MIEFIKSLDQTYLLSFGVILIWGYAMLLVNRIILQPARNRRRIQREDKERMQLRATRRMKAIQEAEGDRTDVWSRTCSHDTISRAIDPALQRKLERLGMAD